MNLTFPFILDGATGTQLQKYGMPTGVSTEQWVLEHPDVYIKIQRAYVEAGSNVVYAPTFAANRVKLAEHKITDSVADYNRQLVQIAKEAADGKALVAGDISPTGKFLFPMGDTSFEELVDIYTEQAKALEEAGVDLYVIETMITVSDARAAVLAVKSISDKPILVTFSCDTNGRTVSGSDVQAVLVILQGMGVDAFGLNCSTGPKEMAAQFARMRKMAAIPLIAKPNAGLPQVVDGAAVYDCPPEEFTAYLEEMAAGGVMLFGGCCGTDETHIAALAEKVKGLTMCPPTPQETDLIPAATEKQVFVLDPETVDEILQDADAVLECDEDLEDNLDEALEDEPEMVVIRLGEEDDLENLAECQYMINVPVCFLGDDADVLEQALRMFQGRALYHGTLDENELAPLVQAYGLIVR